MYLVGVVRYMCELYLEKVNITLEMLISPLIHRSVGLCACMCVCVCVYVEGL